jgi:lysophospholipase L1-like esterase
LLIGINDLAKNISPDTIYVNICKIVSILRTKSPKTKVYVQSILPVNNAFKSFGSHTSRTPQVLEINGKLKSICPKLGATYVDLFSELKNPNDDLLNPMYTNDGLHLIGEGYVAWMKVIQPYL